MATGTGTGSKRPQPQYVVHEHAEELERLIHPSADTPLVPFPDNNAFPLRWHELMKGLKGDALDDCLVVIPLLVQLQSVATTKVTICVESVGRKYYPGLVNFIMAPPSYRKSVAAAAISEPIKIAEQAIQVCVCLGHVYLLYFSVFV